MCLQLLQHGFRDWTKPPLTTLILGHAEEGLDAPCSLAFALVHHVLAKALYCP